MARALQALIAGLALAAPSLPVHAGGDAHAAPAAAHPAGHAAAPAPAAAAAPAVAKANANPSVAAHAAAAAPAAAPSAKPVPAHVGPVDPMDRLREKLAAKLGAAKAPESASPYVVRVTTKADPAAHGAAAHAPAPNAARLAAAHRAAAPNAGHAAAAGHGGHGVHWAYEGEGGPAAWGQLKPEFAQCAVGKRQSPIDIRGGVRVDLEPIKFDYRAAGFAVVDNGHTVQVNLGPGNAIEVMGRRYDLVQFHFHRPSEERIDGRQFDMVAHLVHKDPEGRLAVVAVLLDRGSSHPLVQTVWNNLPLEKGDEVRASSAMDVNHLLPQDRRYYTYMGSLTTPPCSEGVLWMVMAQPVTLSPEQIAVFSRLYPMNARPIQQASGRLIKQSN
jgi:carbonic anhydrase